MNKKYHIHVYKTDVKGEIDVEAKSEEEARGMALEAAKKDLIDFSDKTDCKFIVMSF